MRDLVSAIILLASGLSCLAIDPSPAMPSIKAARIEKPVVLTGKLDDPAWSYAVPVELLFEISPGENTPARQKTEALILYDNEWLYIGFRCYDSVPDQIRAHLSDRDKIFSDDYILATIDTYNNYQRGYEFALNPYGIQGDLLMMGNGAEDLSYDMVWQSAASINSSGWTAEMAIPLKTLSFSRDDIQEWTISLLRCYPRENRYLYTWTPLDRDNPSYIAQGGLLKGLENIKPGRSLEILPYIMAQKFGAPGESSEINTDADALKFRAGGSIQFSPGPNTSIIAVINPDFSQVESDADQVSVNTTFALEYPEKRPFFMSGVDLLQTPMYYSRTINNPLGAVKINGKAGKFSYIALSAYDRNTTIIVPGEEQSNTVETGLESFAGVARARYDAGNENFAGVLFLNRNFTGGSNFVGGLDWNIKFRKSWYFQGELFMSRTMEINDTTIFKSERKFGSTGSDAGFNGEKYIGTGIHLALKREARNYSFSIVQNNFSPVFQTYNGLFPQVDCRATAIQNSYTIYPDGKFLKNATFYAASEFEFNYDNLFKEFYLQPGFMVTMIGQTRLGASFIAINRERFNGVFFSGINRLVFNASSTPAKGVRFTVNGQTGKFIYRSASPELGRGINFTTGAELEPASRIKTTFSWTYAALRSLENDNSFYKGSILRNITTLQFTKRLFLREITQYNSFSKTLNFYPLLTYRFNAFTMFCAGMTQDMNRSEEPEIQFNKGNYQYFVKLQYLFSK